MKKKTVKNINKIKKTNKKLKVLIGVFSGLAICGMLVAGHFIYKNCAPKPDPTITEHDVTLHQPEDETVKAQWVIEGSIDNENWKTGTFKARSNNTIYVRARSIASNGAYKDLPSNVFKICVVYGEGQQQEFSFEKDGDMYKGSFPMMPRSIDIYITAHMDISEHIYTKISNETWIVDSVYYDVQQPIKLYKFDSTFKKEPIIKEYPRTGKDAFNMDIYVGNKVKELPRSFLSSCTEFNSKITFDDESTCEIIGDGFLNYCEKFDNEIIIPDSVKSIGNAFLYGCSSFNKPLNTNNVENLYIGESDYGFMYECTSFNSELKIPNVKQIPSRFLFGCTAFDKTIEIPSSVTKILSEFMYCCDNFCNDSNTKLIVNCSKDAFYSPQDPRTLSVLNSEAPAYAKGIKVDGSLGPQMSSPEMFPEWAEVGVGYRHWRT